MEESHHDHYAREVGADQGRLTTGRLHIAHLIIVYNWRLYCCNLFLDFGMIGMFVNIVADHVHEEGQGHEDCDLQSHLNKD